MHNDDGECVGGGLVCAGGVARPRGGRHDEEDDGFVEKPFSLTPDPKYLYRSESHANAFELLQYAYPPARRAGRRDRRHRHRQDDAVPRGDRGARASNDFSALILNPYMSDTEVLRTILREFGLVTREDIRKGAVEHADVPQLLDTLDSFLLLALPLNSYAVVIIDEAQSLSPKVLDQIRVLALETDGEAAPDRPRRAAVTDATPHSEAAAARSRCRAATTLKPLTQDEMAAYVAHRLTIAGGGLGGQFRAEGAAGRPPAAPTASRGSSTWFAIGRSWVRIPSGRSA